jgi:histidinol-phosphate aminotransferase
MERSPDHQIGDLEPGTHRESGMANNIFRPAYRSISDLVPYSGGKPVEELAREKGLSRIIKLASNENPLGMSPKALEAARKALSEVNRYPDGATWELKERLSDRLGVGSDMIVLGNGSNEILELMAQVFLTEGDQCLYAWPAFVVYRLATMAHGGLGQEVPLDGDLRHDLPAMAMAINEKTKLIFVANPNNPTGTLVTRDEVLSFMDRIPENIPFVLDEAYFEFARHMPEYPDGMDFLREGRQVTVVRTFSKAYGLAGLRVGYAAVPEGLAGILNRVRQPFNVNTVAQAAALAAMDDSDFVERSLEHNRVEIEKITAAVEGMGLSVTPSFTNFILIDLAGRDGQDIYNRLLEKGIIVRPMAPYGLPGTIRVSPGLPEEDDIFLEALEEVLGEPIEKSGLKV